VIRAQSIVALAPLAAIALGGAACNKNARPELPIAIVLMETPPPPGRLVIPVELPAPEPPEPEVVEAPAPPPTPPRRDPVTATRPVERPPAALPEAAPPPVLRTTTDSAATERRIVQLIETAQQNLAKVSFRDLTNDARTQYDSARNFIRQANDALKVKNYPYADFLAVKAASIAGQLVKG
jgi:hypothetical protein